MSSLIDSHCHLYYEPYINDIQGTINASEFSTNANGFLSSDFSLTFTDALSTLGITSADIDDENVGKHRKNVIKMVRKAEKESSHHFSPKLLPRIPIYDQKNKNFND